MQDDNRKSAGRLAGWGRAGALALCASVISEATYAAERVLSEVKVEAAADAEIAAATAAAEAGTWEPVEDLARDVYANGGRP